MKQLKAIFKKYDFPLRYEKPIVAIEEIEYLIKFKIPSEYLFFANHYNSFEGCIGPHYIKLWNFDELIECNRDYMIFKQLPNTLGIGINASSEFIAIEQISKDEQRIILTPLIDLDKQYHIEIGNSFTDFLLRADRGIEWFPDLGDK
jgi:hypothetical protein